MRPPAENRRQRVQALMAQWHALTEHQHGMVGHYLTLCAKPHALLQHKEDAKSLLRLVSGEIERLRRQITNEIAAPDSK